VIFVRSVRYDDDPLFTRFGCAKHLIEGTDSPVIVEELTPRPGESIVEKHTHDCFYKTEMDATLERLGILPETHELLVTGVASNVCVYHAVLGFHVRHYRTVLALDCTAGAPNAEAFVISQLGGRGYNYNVTLSTSDRITITANALMPI
jgi:nicotinamidase-related amidase